MEMLIYFGEKVVVVPREFRKVGRCRPFITISFVFLGQERETVTGIKHLGKWDTKMRRQNERGICKIDISGRHLPSTC
jgi:hypothetical protein